MLFAGFDTSVYTTSLAVVDQHERLVAEARKKVDVKKGERGVRQSEAVFQHLRQLPLLWKEVASRVQAGELQAVAASLKPRPREGSYMPVFRVGESFAAFLSSTLGIPLLGCSHQECHLLAGFWDRGLSPGNYLVLHVSGGTTELLQVNLRESGVEEVTVQGGSRDLAAGQFVDRVGVALGLNFPAGPELEKLSREVAAAEGEPLLAISVDDTWISFSGPASQAQRLLEQGEVSPQALARGVELCLARSLVACVQNAVRRNEAAGGVLLVGGVASNRRIASFIREQVDLPVEVVEPKYAVDNAVGSALYACKKFRN